MHAGRGAIGSVPWLCEISIYTQWSPPLVHSENVPQVVRVALQNRRPDSRDVRDFLEAVGLLERAAPTLRPLSPRRSHTSGHLEMVLAVSFQKNRAILVSLMQFLLPLGSLLRSARGDKKQMLRK